MASAAQQVALFKGHSCFVDEDYTQALQHYATAIEVAPGDADVYSKRAAAHLKLGNNAEAAADASASIKIQPSAKAYLRMGLALFAKQEYESARTAFGNALDIDGSAARELKRWVRKCDAELAPPASQPAASATPAAAAAPPAAPTAPTDASKIRHEWYQTQTHVVVSILARNTAKDAVNVQFEEAATNVAIALGEAGKYELGLRLFATVDAAECKFSVLGTKVEIKLKKRVPGKWDKLEGDGQGSAAQFNTVSADAPKAKPYSGSQRDWGEINADLKKKEEEEKPEGEEALNKLFRDIYGKATDETRKAMNKSFQTSGGTVLSTNWGEVGEKDYEKERTAPDGQEWKKWG